MALEKVGADVRIKNARKAAQDAGRVARSIDDIGDEARQADRQITGMNRASRALSGNMRGMAYGLGAVGVAASGMAFIVGKRSVTAASDLGEEINKNSVVFRGSEQDILQWSKSTSDSLGISRREALQSAGVFGNMLVPMGVARDRAGQMSTRLVDLAADMSSFNNASPEETLEALGAGIAGESEPLRRFGVDIRDAALNAFALEQGIKKSTLEMSSAEKTQILYAKILNDTKDAQGDFANTSSELPNLQRRIAANTENLAAAFGQGLEPGVARAAEALNDFITDVTPAANRIGEAASEILFSSNGLSAGEKASRLFDISSAELGPALGPIVDGIGDQLARVDAGDALAGAIRTGAPVMADALAAQVPTMAAAFVDAFRNAGPGGQLLTVALLAAKFGAFRTVGTMVGGRFAGSFRTGAAKRIQADAAGGKYDAAGRAMGRAVGVAAAVAVAAEIIKGFNAEGDKATNRFQSSQDLIKNRGQPGAVDTLKGIGNVVGGLLGIPAQADGGVTTRSGLSMVGERGPEILHLPRAAQVIPLDRGFGLPSVGGDGGRITFEGPLVIQMGDEVVHRQNVKVQARRTARK
jgi:hypothetical protein